jgi:hypothetical protein
LSNRLSNLAARSLDTETLSSFEDTWT